MAIQNGHFRQCPSSDDLGQIVVFGVDLRLVRSESKSGPIDVAAQHKDLWTSCMAANHSYLIRHE